uniref:YqhA family protein n=1 Tax=Planktotalea sp. TaxID=2029877 RepID=UPI003F6A9C9F
TAHVRELSRWIHTVNPTVPDLCNKAFGVDKPSSRKDVTDFEDLYVELAESINETFHEKYSGENQARSEDKSSSTSPEAENTNNSQTNEKSSERISNYDVGELVAKTNETFEEQFSELLAAQMSRGILRQIEQQYRAGSGGERFFDTALTRLRWIAAFIFLAAIPIVFAIVFILVGESFIVLRDSWSFMTGAIDGYSQNSSEGKKALAGLYGTILSMLDMMLISALVMMVTIGGYENTVSRIGISHAYPRWFGRLDIGDLKIKVAASIATISSIHLLLNFMRIDTYENGEFDQDVIMWTAIVHIVFVASAFILAYTNRLSHADHEPKAHLHRDKDNSGSSSRQSLDTSA